MRAVLPFRGTQTGWRNKADRNLTTSSEDKCKAVPLEEEMHLQRYRLGSSRVEKALEILVGRVLSMRL